LTTEKDQLSDLEKLYKEKKYEEFLASAEKLIADYPESFSINFLYGKVLSDLNRLSESEEILRSLIHSYPDNINLLAELGNLCFRLRNFEQATDYFNKILFLDPFNPLAKQAIDRIEAEKIKSMPGDAQTQPPIEKAHPEPTHLHPIVDDEYEDTVDEFANDSLKEGYLPEEPQAENPQEQPPLKVEEPIHQYRDISLEPDEPMSFPEDSQEILPDEVERQTESGMNTKEAYELDPESIATEDFQEAPVVQQEESSREEDIPSKIPAQSEASTESVEDSSQASPVSSEPVMKIDDAVSADPVLETEAPTPEPTPPSEPAAQTIDSKEPDSEDSQSKESTDAGEDLDFVTDSAAELYLSQRHYEEALKVYEKLYILKKDDSYQQIIKNVKIKCIKQRQINTLNAFLKKIQQRSEEVV